MDEHTLVLIRLIIGLVGTVIVLAFAAKRVLFLTNLIRSGQPTIDENGRKDDISERITDPVQRGLRADASCCSGRSPASPTSSPCGASSSWASVYLEAYGVLFNPEFHIPFVGHWDALGFLQDFFAVAVLLGIITFAIIRLRSEPKEYGRESRFYGSHTGGAWLILFMIFNVIWTFALFRGAVGGNSRTCPTAGAPSSPTAWARCCSRSGRRANQIIETRRAAAAHRRHAGLPADRAALQAPAHRPGPGQRHLQAAARRPRPAAADGVQRRAIDFEDPAEDAMLGRGKIEDFTWKGYLDFTTCTECGRCQSQCPAWNTGKPLSPKLVIMNLRDHLFAKAPYILGDKETRWRTPPRVGSARRLSRREARGAPRSPGVRLRARSWAPAPSRPPVRWSAPLEQGGVIDPDVLWSCTTCGACVEQCPVDIEHIDHIVDMRRYQVLMESEFPAELGVLFKNLENKGNPWGQNAKDRAQLDRRGRVRRPGLRQGRRLLRRLRVPVLGRLRRRLRGPRQEDHQGRRRTARHRRREVPGARRRRDLHRRLGPPRGQRVPVPAARRAEHRDHQRRVRGRRDRRPQDRRHLPALLQHPGPRVHAARRQLHGAAPHPAAEPAGARQEAGRRSPGAARTSPTTTRATWAGTTRSTTRRAS